MLIKRIRADFINARKAKDTNKIAILSTLIGELESKALVTNGEKVISDFLVLSTIKKFIKSIKETLDIKPDDDKLQLELDTLEAYQPKMLSEEELTAVVVKAIQNGSTNMGSVMSVLKAEYPNLYDGKTASLIVNNILKG